MSNQAKNGLVLTVTATAVLPKHRCITQAGDLCAADANYFGVTNASAEIGDVVGAVIDGTALVESGAAIAIDDTLKIAGTTTNAGRLIPWATSGVKVAKALSAASGAGELVEVLLYRSL